jgi:uncharacterized membrane protein
MRAYSRFRSTVIVVLSAVLLVAVAALATAAPPPGKGKAGAAQYAYGPAGKAYGKNRVTICHKGKTIKVAQPAVKAHLRHGDKLGPCP